MSDMNAFVEGFAAFSKGLSITDNPYNETTKKFESWVAGWEGARERYQIEDEENGED